MWRALAASRACTLVCCFTLKYNNYSDLHPFPEKAFFLIQKILGWRVLLLFGVKHFCLSVRNFFRFFVRLFGVSSAQDPKDIRGTKAQFRMGVVCELVKTLKNRLGNNQCSNVRGVDIYWHRNTHRVSIDAKFFNIGAYPSHINPGPVD